MKTKILLFMILSVLVMSCGNSKTKSASGKTILDNSTDKVSELNQEIQSLKDKGIVGKWECNFSGYESIIYLIQKENKYSSQIDFKKNNSENKTEVLIKEGDKYLVSNSSAKEYYKINKDGNLEMWDKDGLFSTAINIMPGQMSKPLPPLKLKDTFRKDVHEVAGNYSKSAPETLNGTDSDIWIVYYKDIDVTFRVYKRMNTIEKAKKGRIPNLK